MGEYVSKDVFTVSGLVLAEGQGQRGDSEALATLLSHAFGKHSKRWLQYMGNFFKLGQQ